MKKLISLALALVMILSLSTVAFADTTEWAAADAKTVTLKKVYTVEGGSTYPAETLNFTSTPAEGNPTQDNLTVASITTTGVESTDITVTTPTYTKVGVYNYTITEAAGNSQAVNYTSDSIGVQVVVTYGEDDKLVASPVLTTTTGEKDESGKDLKQDTFTNDYKLGTLNVCKVISGNLADKDQYFDIEVTFTSAKPVASGVTYTGGKYTTAQTILGSSFTAEDGSYVAKVTIQLKGGDTVTFTDIPAAVEYYVKEDSKHEGEDPSGSNGTKGYTVSYDKQSGSIVFGEKNAITATVTNTKDSGNPGTGIVLDSMPYILLLTLAAAGMFVLLTKKRAKEY